MVLGISDLFPTKNYNKGSIMNYVIILVLLCFSLPSTADYNANHASEIAGIFVYTSSDDIYVQLKDKPDTGCKNNYFIIPNDIPEARRANLLSRLMLAYATKDKINIGYDSTDANCINGYVRIHRIG